MYTLNLGLTNAGRMPVSKAIELVALEPVPGPPSNRSLRPVSFRYAHKPSSEWRRERGMDLLSSDGQSDRGDDGCPGRGVLGGVLSREAESSSPSAAARRPPCGFSHGYAPSLGEWSHFRWEGRRTQGSPRITRARTTRKERGECAGACGQLRHARVTLSWRRPRIYSFRTDMT